MLPPGRLAIWTAAVLFTAACAGRPAPPVNPPTATTLAPASMLFGKYVAAGKIRLDRTLADLNIDDLELFNARHGAGRLRDVA